jgi:hypothetical protein
MTLSTLIAREATRHALAELLTGNAGRLARDEGIISDVSIQPSSLGRDEINAADFRVHYRSTIGKVGWEATEIDTMTLASAMLTAPKRLGVVGAFGDEEPVQAAVAILKARLAALTKF